MPCRPIVIFLPIFKESVSREGRKSMLGWWGLGQCGTGNIYRQYNCSVQKTHFCIKYARGIALGCPEIKLIPLHMNAMKTTKWFFCTGGILSKIMQDCSVPSAELFISKANTQILVIASQINATCRNVSRIWLENMPFVRLSLYGGKIEVCFCLGLIKSQLVQDKCRSPFYFRSGHISYHS